MKYKGFLENIVIVQLCFFLYVISVNINSLIEVYRFNIGLIYLVCVIIIFRLALKLSPKANVLLYSLFLTIFLLGRQELTVHYTKEDILRYIVWFDLLFKNQVVFINVFGNVFLYGPMYLLLILNNHKYLFSVVFCALLSIGFEILQFMLSRGIFDVFDVLLNIVGVLIMFLATTLFRFIFFFVVRE